MSRLSRPTPRLLAIAGALGGLTLFGVPGLTAGAQAAPRLSTGCTTTASHHSTLFSCLQHLGSAVRSSARLRAAADQGDPPYTVVATGLDNPHGLAFDADGLLYVAEAGSGGSGPCVASPEGGVPSCYGPSGAITRIRFAPDGTPTGQERIATGLPSIASPPGISASGPVNLSFHGANVRPYIIIQPASVTSTASISDGGLGPVAGQYFGDLVRLKANGKLNILADIAHYQAVNIPYNGPDAEPKPDSDPYALLADHPAKGIFVVDAAANDLVSVAKDGSISTVAVFPDRSFPGSPIQCGQVISPTVNNYCYQSVPDSIARGPDGALYVGELGGGGAPVGGENVYRIEPGATTIQNPSVFRDGFTSISSIAFGPDGSLYVLEIFEHGLDSGNPTGALIRVAPDGTRTTIASGLSGGLFAPTGLAISPDGKYAYVSNFGICPAVGGGPCPSTGGEVVRFDLSASGPGPGPTPTPELGSGELLAAGLLPIMAALLYRRRRSRRAELPSDTPES